MAELKSSGGGEQPHVLVVPFPAQGHMIPLLDLVHILACRGVAATVVVTPKNLALLSPTLSRRRPAGAGPIQTLVLPFPPHPSIPDGVENARELPPTYFLPMMHAFGGLRDSIYRWALQKDEEAGASVAARKPDVIISDFLAGWTFHLAADLRIPRIVFTPFGANFVAPMHWTWRNIPMRSPGSVDDPNYPVCFSGTPNSPTHAWHQISMFYREYLEKKGELGAEFVRDGFVVNMASWGYVFNSSEALELPYLEHMKLDLGHPSVWAVGPLGIYTGDAKEAAERGGRSSVATDEVLQWLDGCPHGAVVYVCFGSQVMMRPPQIESIATALERSGARFVWVIKEGTKQRSDEGPDMLEGFERRTAGAGLVIRGWAPQVAILSHRATGWFLSHCGWNSVLESVAAGVALLTWPMFSDQYFNARVLADELGVAVKACEGPDTVPDPDALAKIIRDAAAAVDPAEVGSDADSVYRRTTDKVRTLGELARDSVRAGGSSDRDLNGLVEELRKLKHSPAE